MKSKKRPPSAPSVSLVTLGCAKNLVDTERILAQLAQAGFLLVDSDSPADVAIINSCGFIATARDETIENVRAALDEKRQGRLARVIVTGCLSQLWGPQLAGTCPGLDAVVGLAQRDNIAAIVAETLADPPAKNPEQCRIIVDSATTRFIADDQTRLRITEPSWAYLRISEGCNQRCSFCTIPAIRGPFRSKPLKTIIAEANELVTDGAVELNLIGQETTSYGSDSPGATDLAELLTQLNRIDDLRWIRVLYAHPASITDRHIAAFADCPKVAPYLDIPLQHINDRILKLMHRRINRTQTEQLIDNLRRTIDNLTLRTTMLVGFPSETPEEFTELLDFVRDYRFEALGAFAYSSEPGTAAAKLPDPVPEDVKHQRAEQLMLTQQKIAFEHADHFIGRSISCLITGPAADDQIAAANLPSDQDWFIARHPGQAPEIDSCCFLTANPNTAPDPGDIVPAAITARHNYDLIGSIDPPARQDTP